MKKKKDKFFEKRIVEKQLQLYKNKSSKSIESLRFVPAEKFIILIERLFPI